MKMRNSVIIVICLKKGKMYSKSYKVVFVNQHKCLNTGEVWFVF